MYLLEKRPLFAACAALIFAAFLGFYLSQTGMIVLLSIVAALFFVLFLWHTFYRRSSRVFVLLLVLALFLAGGASAMKQARERESFLTENAGKRVAVELTVKEVTYRYAYASKVEAKITSQNREKCSRPVMIFIEDRFPFECGDVISGEFFINDPTSGDGEWGDARTIRAEGYEAVLTEGSDLALVKSGANGISARLADFRATLKYTFFRFFDHESAGLFSAMLLGFKKDLDTRTVRDFRQLGISHLVAVSGLHLMIFTGAWNRFLLLCRAGKKTRMAILSFVAVGYCVLCGGAAPVVRASLMLLLYYLSDLVGGDRDTLTTLSVAAAIMVFLSPNIIFQLSFEMTVLATFGIAAFNEWRAARPRRHLPRKRLPKFAVRASRGIGTSLLITFAATLALLPIEWLVFGEISLMLPISNLIFVPFAAPLLTGGFLLLFLTPFPTPARIVAIPLGALSEVFLSMSSRLSRIDCMLSLRYAFVPFILIPLLALTIALLSFDLKRWRASVFLPAVLAAVAFAVCLGVSTRAGRDTLTVTFRSVGANEGMVLTQNGKSAWIDFSNESYKQMTLNERAAEDEGAHKISTIVFTHYHKTLPNTLSRYLKTTFVREIRLPMPQNEDEEGWYQAIQSIAANEGVALALYRYNEEESLLDGVRFVLYTPLYEKRSTQPALALDLRFYDNTLRYECGAYREFLHNAGFGVRGVPYDDLLLGTHGPRPHEEIFVAPFEVRKSAVVFSEQNTKYFAEDMSFFVFSDGIWKEKFVK